MMQPKTLGQLLAQTKHQEENHSLELAEARANAKNEEARKRWNLIKDFYENAKVVLTKQIQDRIPTKKLGVLVVQTGTDSQNIDVYNYYGWYGKEARISPQNETYPLWKAFCEWAHDQDLVPVWDYQWDGGGVHSWYILRLTPIPPATRR